MVEVLGAEGPAGLRAIATFWDVLAGGLGLEEAEDFGAGLGEGRSGEAVEGTWVIDAFCEVLGVG